jgi:hypothetical protein
MPDRDWFDPVQAPDLFDGPQESTTSAAASSTSQTTEEHYRAGIDMLDKICSRSQRPTS